MFNQWYKSSRSAVNNCVMVFRKSSFSNPSGNSVELADLEDGGVALKDSKLGDKSPVLTFDSAEWSAFIAGVKAGEFG